MGELTIKVKTNYRWYVYMQVAKGLIAIDPAINYEAYSLEFYKLQDKVNKLQVNKNCSKYDFDMSDIVGSHRFIDDLEEKITKIELEKLAEDAIIYIAWDLKEVMTLGQAKDKCISSLVILHPGHPENKTNLYSIKDSVGNCCCDYHVLGEVKYRLEEVINSYYKIINSFRLKEYK